MFATELELESYIRELVLTQITSKNQNVYLLTNKDVVDMIICNDTTEKLFFLEAKYLSPKNERIGFGSANGAGFQPEILNKKPKYFDKYMRWIFGRPNDPLFYVFSPAEISNYFAGGVIGDKQNNFQKKLFSHSPGLTDLQLLEYLNKWLLD